MSAPFNCNNCNTDIAIYIYIYIRTEPLFPGAVSQF